MSILYRYYQAVDLSPLWSQDDTSVQTVEVGSQSAGERVVFQVKWQAGQVAAVRYRIHGCPYLIASTVNLAQWLIGRTHQQTAEFSMALLVEQLEMPAHKHHVAQLMQQVVREI